MDEVAIEFARGPRLLGETMTRVANGYEEARLACGLPRTAVPLESVLYRLFNDNPENSAPDKSNLPVDSVISKMRAADHWPVGPEEIQLKEAYQKTTALIDGVVQSLQMQRVLGRLASRGEADAGNEIHLRMAQFGQRLAQAYYLSAQLPSESDERLYMEAFSDMFISLTEHGLSSRVRSLLSGACAQAAMMNLIESRSQSSPESTQRYTLVTLDADDPAEIEATDGQGVDFFVVDNLSNRLMLVSAKGDHSSSQPDIIDVPFNSEKHGPAVEIAIGALEGYDQARLSMLRQRPRLIQITLPTGRPYLDYGAVAPEYAAQFGTIITNSINNLETRQYGPDYRRAA